MNPFFIDPNIARAKTLDTEFYTSPKWFEAAKDKIFLHSWQFAGCRDMIKFPGDVYPFTLLEHYLNEPLMLTHDREGQVHCLSNVCTHRGNLLVGGACSKAAHLRCRYHGRIFDLKGKMVSMPEFKEVEDFPAPEDNLKQLALFEWGNLLFTSLKPEGNALPWLKDMMERMHWLPIGEFVFRPDLGKTYDVNANWALYCENYLEGFHIPFVHAGLNQALSYTDYTTELFEKSNLQIGVGKDNEDCFDLPRGSVDYGQKIAAYYFWVYPNMMFNFYPWGLSVNVVSPVAPDKTRVHFLVFMWKEEKYDKGAGSNLDRVEKEDEEIVEHVQRGIRSRFYRQGRYSVTRETGTHHFHRLIAESFAFREPAD